MEFAEADWEYFTGSPRADYPLKDRFGVRVEGDSMDLLYPPGTILECARYWGNEPIRNGKRVIVQRTKVDGTVETTVKEYLEDRDGVVWLLPKSSNPAFQAPIRADERDDSITEIRIMAVVIASIRLEE